MKCPNDALPMLRCDQILNAAEMLIEDQGIVSFKFSQLAKEAECSTGTLYKFFERKEDVLVCLFLRGATSNFIPLFIEKHPELTAQERTILPILFTFETIKKSKSFFTLRSVSVNAMIWKLASDEKVRLFKQRINTFWSKISESLNEAVEEGELIATPLQMKELTQGIIFYLTGSLTQFESELISEEFLSLPQETLYRHLARLMGQYQWQKPLTHTMYDSLEQRVAEFYEKYYKHNVSCKSCKQFSDSLGGCHSDHAHK